jgi:hypothetical protein
VNGDEGEEQNNGYTKGYNYGPARRYTLTLIHTDGCKIDIEEIES